jgi:hypothetical protein
MHFYEFMLFNTPFQSDLARMTLAMILLQICSGTRHGVLHVVYYICPIGLLASIVKCVKSCYQRLCWKVEHANFCKLSQTVLLIHQHQLFTRTSAHYSIVKLSTPTEN